MDTGGYYEFREHAFNDAGNSEYSNTSAAYNRSALENWRFTHYGRIDNAGDVADYLDINDNGVSNLLAFALNLDPLDNHVRKTDGNTPGLPESYVENGIAKYRFLKPGGRDNIDYKVELTTNLVSWVTVSVNSTGQTGIYEQMEATAPQNLHPCFFRLVVDRTDV